MQIATDQIGSRLDCFEYGPHQVIKRTGSAESQEGGIEQQWTPRNRKPPFRMISAVGAYYDRAGLAAAGCKCPGISIKDLESSFSDDAVILAARYCGSGLIWWGGSEVGQSPRHVICFG